MAGDTVITWNNEGLPPPSRKRKGMLHARRLGQQGEREENNFSGAKAARGRSDAHGTGKGPPGAPGIGQGQAFGG